MLLACAVLATVSINYVGLINVFHFRILNYKAFLFAKIIHLILYECQLFKQNRPKYLHGI